MFTISLIGQKGGTGKTTTAVELAVTAANAGETVAVIDLDPQANAANWKDRRAADNPYVVATPPVASNRRSTPPARQRPTLRLSTPPAKPTI
jgi:cellulose biosynthesis protein BcsQ